MRNTLILLVLSLIAVLPACLPLFHSGFFTFHDNEQVARLYDLNKDIVNLNFPPRLTQDLGYGFDYPLFNFYPPLVYYIAEIFKLTGFSYITSIKITIGLGFYLSFIFMYLFAKEHFGKIAAFLAALSYTYLPYHSVDVYVRGALPEFWSFVFIPLVFFSILKFYQTQKTKYIALLAFSFAFLILSHDLMAMVSGVFIVGYAIYLLILSKNKKRFLVFTALGLLLGFLISAYFWIPALLEKKYTMVYLLTTELANYNLHFVCIKQFWNSPWGYSGSLPGCFDGLSFQVGKIQIIASFLAMLFGIFLLFNKKLQKSFLLLTFFVLFIFSLFMQTKYSILIWQHIPALWYLQFPWRFLILSGFTASFLVASLLSFKRREKLKIPLLLLIGILVFVLNISYFKPFKYINVNDGSYINGDMIKWNTSNLSFEYVPYGIKTKKSNIGNTIVAINKDQIAKSTAQAISENLQVNSTLDTPVDKRVNVSSNMGGVLRLNTFTFPGWETFLDGKNISYSSNNALKLITVSVPPGNHTLEAKFFETQIRKTSDIVSVLAVLISLILLWPLTLKNKHEE